MSRFRALKHTLSLGTLNLLFLSSGAFVTGTASSGTIIGATGGSTITASGLPSGLTINGAARTWAWDGTGSVGSGSFTLTESLAGYTTRISTISYSISTTFSPPSGALKSGVNFNAMGWTNWLWQNRFATAGAWTSSPSNAGIDPTYLDANYYPKQVPPGQTSVNHAITNSGGPQVIKWTGNMAGGGPISNSNTTISAVDSVNRTCLATPVSTAAPMSITYGINSTDTTNGTYPGSGALTGGIGIYAYPQGETITTFDANIVTELQSVSSGGPLRLCRMSGVEQNGGPSNPPSSTYGWGAPWGKEGATQSSPTYKITMANRAGLNSGVWSALDDSAFNNPSVAYSGLPVEAAVQLANTVNRDIWWHENWNSDPAVWAYNAAYLRDHLSSTLTVHVSVSNEVWNAGTYAVGGQAAAEAGYNSSGSAIDPTLASYRTSGTAIPLLTTGSISYNAAGARYCEKLVEVFSYYNTAFAAASSQPGGVKPTLIRMCDWWHSQGSSMAALLLDYVANNAGGVPLRSLVDAYSTSVYPHPGSVDPTMDGNYDVSRGSDPLFLNLYYDVENLAAISTSVRATCDARSVKYFHYEMGDYVNLDSNDSTGMTLAASVQRDARMRPWQMFFLRREEVANPGAAFAWYDMWGGIASKEGTFALKEKPLQDPNGTPPAPLYLGKVDWNNGIRTLQDLYGLLTARVGAQVGEVVGYLRRRDPTSTFTLNSAFQIADPTALILKITVADATAFTSAGTVNCVINETGGNPSTTHPTTLPCTVTASTFWKPTTPNMVIESAGLSCRNVSTLGEDVAAVASLARANGYVEFTVSTVDNSNVGFVGSTYPGTANMFFRSDAVTWYSNAGTVVINGTVQGTLTSWTSGDALDLFISTSGKLYGRKNNGSWLPTGANPATDTGGIDISSWITSMGGTVKPACNTERPAFGVTLRAATASFIHTPPTGAHDWNS